MKRRTAMISKTKIGVILSSAMVASAMVCFGVAHRHHQSPAAITTINPHVEQIPTTPKPPAGKPLDAADDQNQTDAANDPNAAAQRSSDTADDSNRNQPAADGQEDAGRSDHGQAADAATQLQTASYAASPVRVKSVGSAKVVRPVVAATTGSLDRPISSVASIARRRGRPSSSPLELSSRSGLPSHSVQRSASRSRASPARSIAT
jgi:hypothetical protein